MLYYRIHSGVASGICLDISNSSNALIINTQSNNDTQLWQPIALVDNQTTYGIAFLNKSTGLVLHALNADEQVVQMALAPNWGPNWVGWNLAGGGAIQVAAETNLNLNVQGGGSTPGTSVIVYKWQGGKPNETWWWEPVFV